MVLYVTEVDTACGMVVVTCCELYVSVRMCKLPPAEMLRMFVGSACLTASKAATRISCSQRPQHVAFVPCWQPLPALRLVFGCAVSWSSVVQLFGQGLLCRRVVLGGVCQVAQRPIRCKHTRASSVVARSAEWPELWLL